MKIVSSPDMPISKGHYSMCVEHNGTLYLAGQLPTNPSDGSVPESIESQTQLVLNKVKTILTAADSSLDKVIHMRIYISDIELWGKVNQVYADFFGKHKPARIVIPVSTLHYGCLIEVEAIAAQ